MTVFKQHGTRSTSHKESTGLLACGSSGPWAIDIDETTSGTDRWFAQVEGPSIYLYFEIPSPEMVDHVLRFLAGIQGKRGRNPLPVARNTSLTLARDALTRVNLIQDDEFADRFFLVIEPKGGSLVRFTITGDDLKNVTEALRQAKEDIEGE